MSTHTNVTSTRRRCRRALTVIAVVTLGCLWATPAEAKSQEAVDYSGCDFAGTGAQFTLRTRVTGWDNGGTVKIPGGKSTYDKWWNTGRVYTQKGCDGEPVSRLIKSFSHTVTAYGTSVECGVGLPKSVSCSGSGSQVTIELDSGSDVRTGADGVFQTSLGAGDYRWFTDGGFGDTDKVCSVFTVRAGADRQSTRVEACASTDAD